MRIAIVGNCGSGKSTLGLQLHKIVGIPLYHLDQYFWKPGWQVPPYDEFEKIHNNLCDANEWIIEGMSIRNVEYRFKRSDTIIFLDIPTYRCVYRVYKRAFIYFGKIYFSNAQGCLERYPDFKFLKYILNFTKEKKPIIESLVQDYSEHKKIFLIRNKNELNSLIKNFELNKSRTIIF